MSECGPVRDPSPIQQVPEADGKKCPEALISYVDSDLRYLWANQTYERWFGVPLEKVIGSTLPEVMGDEMHARERPFVNRALAGEEVHFQSLLTTPGGRSRLLQVTYTPDLDAVGRVAGFGVVASEILEGQLTSEDAVRERAQLTRSIQERANAEISQFAQIAAHDLHSPLRMIRTYTQLLERRLRPQLDESAKEFIGIVLNGSERMEKLISSLSDFAQAGESEHEMLLIPMATVVSDALSDLEVLIQQHNVEVICGELPVIRGDANKLTQVVQNTVNNSVLYRRVEVPLKILIGAIRTDNMWQFCIEDNGQGIASQYLEHVFKPFKRLHGQEIAGTGMGLAVCRRIIERHGGRMWAESEPASGVRFYFTLPVVEPNDLRKQ